LDSTLDLSGPKRRHVVHDPHVLCMFSSNSRMEANIHVCVTLCRAEYRIVVACNEATMSRFFFIDLTFCRLAILPRTYEAERKRRDDCWGGMVGKLRYRCCRTHSVAHVILRITSKATIIASEI
jgi:hypothetical protein